MGAGEWWTYGTNPGATQSGTSIAARVHRFIEERPEEDRTDGWHISSLYHTCPREIAMQAVLGPPERRRVFEPRLKARFDVGTALHSWWQNKYLGPAGVLLGQWRCSGCREVREGTMPSKAHDCAVHAKWKFVETRVEYREAGWSRPIVGRFDGEVECDPPEGETDRVGVLEIKTASFMPIKEVSADYVWQCQCYMHIRRRRWTRFLFVDPACLFRNDADSKHDLPCQEIVVKYDPRYWELAVARVREVEAVFARMSGGAYRAAGADFGWPEKICPDKQCRTAQRCAFKDRCFDAVQMAQVQLRVKEGRDPVTGATVAEMADKSQRMKM